MKTYSFRFTKSRKNSDFQGKHRVISQISEIVLIKSGAAISTKRIFLSSITQSWSSQTLCQSAFKSLLTDLGINKGKTSQQRYPTQRRNVEAPYLLQIGKIQNDDLGSVYIYVKLISSEQCAMRSSNALSSVVIKDISYVYPLFAVAILLGIKVSRSNKICFCSCKLLCSVFHAVPRIDPLQYLQKLRQSVKMQTQVGHVAKKFPKDAGFILIQRMR